MSNTISEPIKKKRKIVLFIWILPLIAILIATLMTYKHYSELGEEIIIEFNNADGFDVNKTPLKYKGITIGKISDIEINEKDINKFLVKINLTKTAKKIVAREGTEFWKVEPKVSLTEISGLNTILSGNYIEVKPAKKELSDVLEKKVKTYFIAKTTRPIKLFDEDGTFITLKSKKGSLPLGTPILYKNFIVGEVVQKKLDKDEIFYLIFIQKQYSNLLKDDSYFWNVSGMEVKASLSGIKMKIDTLQSIVSGGISFDSKKGSQTLTNKKKIFKLYDSKEDIGFSEKLITLKSKETYGLEKEFSKIHYNGLTIGKVYNFEYIPEKKVTNIYIKLQNKFVNLLSLDPHFQIIKPEIGFDKINGLDTLIKSNYIKLTTHSNKEKKVKPHFNLNTEKKKISMFTMSLKTFNDTKVNKNSPVYYKNKRIGYVSHTYLDKGLNQIIINLRVYWIYRNLINDSSLFYEQAPIEFKANLKEVSVKTAPIKSFINSGIAIITDDLTEKASKKSFTLYKDHNAMQEAKYLLQKGTQYKIKVTHASEIKIGESIFHKGIEAGKVVSSTYNEKDDEIYFEIFVLDKFTHLINTSTRFYSISAIDVDLSLENVNIKTKSFVSMFNGGISFYTHDKHAKEMDTTHHFDLYKSLEEAKERFVSARIKMSRGFDLKRGSKILYKDLVVGTVYSLGFIKNDKVEAIIHIDKKHMKLLNKNSIFYLDKFKFSLSEVTNPGGVLLGSRIKVIAGDSTITKRDFDLVTYKPIEGFDKTGLRVIVNAKLKSSLKQNSPVYYRQIQIGAVEKFKLSEDSTNVKLQLFIEKKYAYLIRKNSLFYNAGAFGVDFYLFGVKIKTETLETLISGGISLMTPTDYGKKANDFDEFKLYKDLDEKWLSWNPKIKYP